LTIRNDGPGLATDIVLTDVLPGGVTVRWAEPAQPACERQGSDVGCELGDLQGGDAVTLTLDLAAGESETGVRVDTSAPSCLIGSTAGQPQVICRLSRLPAGSEAQARVGLGTDVEITRTIAHTAAVTANETDPERTNNRVTVATTLGPGPEQGERHTRPDLALRAAGPSLVTAGRPFTRTFTLTNLGSQDATGVRFESVVPPGTALNAYAPGLPACKGRDAGFTCTLRDPGNDKSISFTLLITGRDEGPVVVEPDPLLPGWPGCYMIKERQYLHILICELGTLRPGETARLQMNLTAEGVQERALAHTASAAARETDPAPLDNSDTTTMTVQVRSDLLVRADVAGPAHMGETVRCTLTVTNLGPSDAAGVTLVDRWSPGASLISAASRPGTECRVEGDAGATEALRCTIGRLSSGEAVTVTLDMAIDAVPDPAQATALTHTASVQSEQIDPYPGNNRWSELIPVIVRKEQ
jgi:uncharacterized repeat protein (TIGR01451 family)